MKHTTVCGKSADRPIGGTCRRKSRPHTMIESEPVWFPPSLAVDWLSRVSCQYSNKPLPFKNTIGQISQTGCATSVIHWSRVFNETSIPRISSCKPETSPRWNLIGHFSHELTSSWSCCLGSLNVNSIGSRYVAFGDVSLVSFTLPKP